ncbi:hypothetical protein F3J34_13980 [Klebsiella sp. Ap-873]|nr:hypothetical protein [Klebsiella sp. Ap-873]
MNALEAMSTAHYARQLNSLLENIFEKGCGGCESNNELIGLAFDLAGKVCSFMDKLDQEANK